MKKEIADRIENKTLIPYLRVSNDMLSTDRQLIEINGQLGKHELKSDQCFEDMAQRDNLRDRLGWQELLTYIKTNKIKNAVVLIDEQDRVFSGWEITASILSQANNYNFEIISLKDNCFLTDVENHEKLFKDAFGSQDYQNKIATKILSSKTQYNNLGLYGGGYISGYTSVAFYKCKIKGKDYKGKPQFCYTDDGQLIKEEFLARYELISRDENVYEKTGADGIIKKITTRPRLTQDDREQGIKAFLELSHMPKRIETIKYIFETIDKEEISAKNLIIRLNENGFRYWARGWNSKLLKEVIPNRAIIGLPTIGKRAKHPRYYYDEEGDLQPISRMDAYPTRKEDNGEIYGKHYGKMIDKHPSHIREPKTPRWSPIVDVDMFNRVNEKIKTMWGRDYAPPRKIENFLKNYFFFSNQAVDCDNNEHSDYMSLVAGDGYFYYKTQKHKQASGYVGEKNKPNSCSCSLKMIKQVIKKYFEELDKDIDLDIATTPKEMGAYINYWERNKDDSWKNEDLKFNMNDRRNVWKFICDYANKQLPEEAPIYYLQTITTNGDAGWGWALSNDGELTEQEINQELKKYKNYGGDIEVKSPVDYYNELIDAKNKELKLKIDALQIEYRNLEKLYRAYTIDDLPTTELKTEMKILDIKIKDLRNEEGENLLNNLKELENSRLKYVEDVKNGIRFLREQEYSKFRGVIDSTINKVIAYGSGGSVEAIKIVGKDNIRIFNKDELDVFRKAARGRDDLTGRFTAKVGQDRPRYSKRKNGKINCQREQN